MTIFYVTHNAEGSGVMGDVIGVVAVVKVTVFMLQQQLLKKSLYVRVRVSVFSQIVI